MPTNDSWLDRRQVAEELTKVGFKTATSTLASMATRGGGPQYRLFGRKPIYRWGDALAWAEGRCSRVVSSTSEMSAAARLGHLFHNPGQQKT